MFPEFLKYYRNTYYFTEDIIQPMSLNNLRNISKNALKKTTASAKRLAKKPVSVITDNLPGKLREKVKQSPIYYRLFKPSRPQRVYLKKGLSHMKFLQTLNERKVEYVLLRWWKDLPDYPAGEDLNILVKDEHRDQINDLVSIFEQDGMKCDLYTVTGVKNGSRFNVPVFSQNLTRDLLNDKIFYNGAFVPAEMPYFASVAYHAIFHKGHNSGIPGFCKKPTKYVFNYTEYLEVLAKEQEIEIEISVQGLYNFLLEKGYAPAVDTLAKIAVNCPEISILEPALCSDIRGGELLTFVIRERLLTDGLLNDLAEYLEQDYQFDILDVKILTDSEKEICNTQIRGGKWDKGPWKESGGPPVALIVAFDYHPVPLTDAEQKTHPRITNYKTVKAKYGYRKRLNKINGKREDYNGLHSADNEHDSWFYISLMGNEYKGEILKKVELRRDWYSVKWGVVKVLAHGPVSKVELIKYNKGLAVKKTFRPGKEGFFKRELFCTKDLSKDLRFIPPLIEEGEGYFIVPFIENILDSLDPKAKRRKISDKKQEIFKVIWEMYQRNLSFINFNPESIIITPKDELFCTGYSYVQHYTNIPESLNEAFEIAGIPENFEGDLPHTLKATSGSFQKVWKGYFSWGEFKKNKSFQPGNIRSE